MICLFCFIAKPLQNLLHPQTLDIHKRVCSRAKSSAPTRPPTALIPAGGCHGHSTIQMALPGDVPWRAAGRHGAAVTGGLPAEGLVLLPDLPQDGALRGGFVPWAQRHQRRRRVREPLSPGPEPGQRGPALLPQEVPTHW